MTNSSSLLTFFTLHMGQKVAAPLWNNSSFSPFPSLPLQKERKALFESSPAEQRLHILQREVTDKKKWWIDSQTWLNEWSDTTFLQSLFLRMCVLMFNSISSLTAQSQSCFFVSSCAGQQLYLLRYRPYGSPSTQHGQQSRMRVRACWTTTRLHIALLNTSPLTIALQFHHPWCRFDRQFLLLENLEGASQC